MTILVTGGAGFLGSHLCARLLAEGHKVLCLDNLLTGSERNIAGLKANPNFTFVKHDVVEPMSYESGKIDQIYNLACPASPVHYQKDAIATIKASTLGVINALELARRHGARFFQASTSEIYGDPLEHPQKETYRGNVNPIGPRACYDEGKRVAETLCFDYHRQHGLDIRVARIFNTYGPNMSPDDGRVVSNFIIQALAGQPLTVYGDGSQTRSFCYVDDLIEGFYRLMNAEGFTGPVNLGNPGSFTMNELADLVITRTGSDSKKVPKPLPTDDPRHRQPDISLAKEKLGWEPKIKFADGLAKTIEYFRDLK